MSDPGAYKLTLVAAVVVLALSAGVVLLFGGPAQAAPYLTLIATLAIPSLLSLLRSEQTAKQVTLQHRQMQQWISVQPGMDEPPIARAHPESEVP